MSHAVLSRTEFPTSSTSSSVGLVVGLLLGVWFTLVILLGATEAFVTPNGRPPLALLISTTSPVIVFLGSYWISSSFREFILKADLRLIMAIQAWRIGGFSFPALYAYGILPGFLAWPAGLGDIAIGLTAPLILAALIRRPSFAASRTFGLWNVLGILDLMVAVSMGALGSRLLSNGLGTLATAPMSYLPLVVIPTFFLPAFIMLHLASLFQARSLRQSE
jgi:hypothetical protein